MLVILLTLVAGVSARVRYDGYHLVQATPTTVKQVEQLRWLAKVDNQLDFWTEPVAPGVPVDIMLTPGHVATVGSLFGDIPYTILNKDVQTDFDAVLDNVNMAGIIDPNNYNSLEVIDIWMLDLPLHCPPLHQCETRIIGHTYEKRPVMLFHMHRPGTDRHAHWIDAATHAREWISTATLVRFMDHLVKMYDQDVEARRLADDYDWYFVPVVNADGYKYSMENDTMWRKNRRFIDVPENNLGCIGVDVNRNFEYSWATEGSSDFFCAFNFHGPSAASEVETQNVQNKIAEVSDQLVSMTTIHAYGYMWMFPWGTTVDHAGAVCARTSVHDQVMRVANATADALGATHGTYWDRGTSCEVIYAASGTTTDFAYGAHGIKYAWAPELRGNSFQPPAFNIQLSFEEFWNGIMAMVTAIDLEENY